MYGVAFGLIAALVIGGIAGYFWLTSSSDTQERSELIFTQTARLYSDCPRANPRGCAGTYENL